MEWKAHKLLAELHDRGVVKGNLKAFAELTRLVEMGFILGDAKAGFTKGDGFDEVYAKKYHAEYLKWKELLSGIGLLDADGLSGEDIERLCQIEADAGELLAREGLTLKQVSSQYFGGSKQVKKGSILEKAISTLLPGLIATSTSSQYLIVLHSEEAPKAIVLCENMDQMNRPRRKHIELWYAGGNNTAKLAYAPFPFLPMYYLCDWDYAGLSIYCRIKEHYFPGIQLVEADFAASKYIEATGHHGWNDGLNWACFNSGQREKIERLIAEGLWIEEESFGGELEGLVHLD